MVLNIAPKIISTHGYISNKTQLNVVNNIKINEINKKKGGGGVNY